MSADGVGKPADPDSAPWGRIDRAHRDIRRLLANLEQAQEIGEILKLAKTLTAALADHFAEEEAPDGLFEEIERTRPGNAHQLRSLRREHRAILESLELVCEQGREAERALIRIRTDAAALVRQIQVHEETETCLVMDTYLVDDGGPS